MGMFNVRKPRGFNHQYIYVDERKEKLAKMEEDAKRDLGILPGYHCPAYFSVALFADRQLVFLSPIN